MRQLSTRFVPLPFHVRQLTTVVGGPTGVLAVGLQAGALRAAGEWRLLEVDLSSRAAATATGFWCASLIDGKGVHVDAAGKVAEQPGSGPGPAPNLARASFAWDAARDRLVLFGGAVGGDRAKRHENATWEWKDGAWTQPKVKGKPDARISAVMCHVPPLGGVAMVGGYKRNFGHLHDTAVFDGKTWTVFDQAMPAEAADLSPLFLCFDAPSGQLLLGRRLKDKDALGVYRYLSAGRWEPCARIQHADVGTPEKTAAWLDFVQWAFEPSSRRLVCVGTEPGTTQLVFADVDLAGLLDALPKQDWSMVAAEAPPPKAPAAPAAPEAPLVPRRYLTMREDGADKFWFAELQGAAYTLRWGRRGTTGQEKRYELATAEKAEREFKKKVEEKLQKGYADAPEGAAAATLPQRESFEMRFTPAGAPPAGADQILGAPPAALDDWPRCKSCGGPMEFLALFHAHGERLPLTEHAALALFQCPQPKCPVWKADAGASAVLLLKSGQLGSATPVPAELRASAAAAIGYGKRRVEHEPEAEQEEGVGQGSKLGGYPSWIQEPVDPHQVRCGCGKAMTFRGQIDGGETGMSFGDLGTGYFFVCPDECEGRFVVQGA